MNPIAVGIALIVTLFTGPEARGQFGVPCVGNCGLGPGQAEVPVIDDDNLAQNIIQIARLVTQIGIMRNQLENMLLNTLKGGGAYHDPLPLLHQLRALLTRAHGLGYAVDGIDGIFRARFPGYTPYVSWHDDYEKWTASAMDTLANTLANLHAQSEAFAGEVETAARLKLASDHARGRMEAIQSGNALTAELLNQTIKMKQIAMAQSNAYAVAEGRKINEDAQTKAWVREWLLRGGEHPMPAYGSGSPVWSVPYPK
jgi:P-type conjugative transfer protein TrbJ